MFEQDYIMRLIHEMIRTILKLLFNIDTDSPTADLLGDSEEKAALDALLNMADEGKLNEAESVVYEITESLDRKSLEVALLFYSYVNEMPDEFLEENNYSRDDVKQGLKEIASRYGLDSIADMFLQ